MEQISFDDLVFGQERATLPGRIAYIDECGSFGFDFSKEGTSTLYTLCAVIVKNTEIEKMHIAVEEVKCNNGFSHSEMKSSVIGNNYKRRNKIIAELLPIEFRVVLLVADKREFVEGSPLAQYKRSFIKFIHQRLYDRLYRAYPKLKIIEDQTGTDEFQTSFRRYVEEHRPTINMFDEYDFDYSDSKDSLLVQLADIVAGTINKSYTDSQSPNYVEMLKGKILCIDEFPNRSEPYWGTNGPDESKYDRDIFELAVRCANAFISKYEQDESYEKRLQIALLRYLLFQVYNVDAQKFISSNHLLSILSEYADGKVRRDFLYRRIIAPLRDAGVILASSAQGYKIPISSEDITTYLNQTHTVVSPMLHRIEICRNLIKQQTDNNMDILEDPAFLRYKGYFE